MRPKKQTEEDKQREKTRAFLDVAMKRWKESSEAEAIPRKESLEDVKFSVGDQWSSDIKADRQIYKRPCLTLNQLPKFIRLVKNEIEDDMPAIQVTPEGDGADVQTAEDLQGLLRHVEVNSDAQVVYETGFDQMLRSGFGYWRVTHDYAGFDSFDQEVFIEWIENQFTVYGDPYAKKPDRSDSNWGFIVCDYSREEFKTLYPKAEAASLMQMVSVGDRSLGWLSKDTVRVAEYFYVEEVEKTAALLMDGSIVDSSSIPEGQAPLKERKRIERKWKKALITQVDILEQNDWPGRFYPIIRISGEEVLVDGVRTSAGIVRYAKDPQRQYNFWTTALTEKVALQPKAKYLVAKGQLEGEEENWKRANTTNFPFLYYKPVDSGGKPVAAPQLIADDPAGIQAMTVLTRGALEDMQGTIGLNDANLGMPKQQQSGVALLQRRTQGSASTSNFKKYLYRAVRYTGQVALDMVQHIYDTPRIVRIIKPDDSIDHIITHKGTDQAAAAQAMITDRIKRVRDLSVGRYDISITTGNYQSKRQEAVASQIEVLKILPPPLQAAILDLLVRNMDWPGAKEIADRLKKMLPPQLQEGDQDDPEIKAQKAQAQATALQQANQILTQELTAAVQKLTTKQLELESKERIAIVQAQAGMVEAQLKANAAAGTEAMKAQFAALQSRLDLLHETMSLQQEAALNPPAPAATAAPAGAQ